MANLCSNDIFITFGKPLSQTNVNLLADEKAVFDKIRKYMKKQNTFKSEEQMQDEWFFIAEACSEFERCLRVGHEDARFLFDSKWSEYNAKFPDMIKIFEWESVTNEYQEPGSYLAGCYKVSNDGSEIDREVPYRQMEEPKSGDTIYYCGNQDDLEFMVNLVGEEGHMFFNTSDKDDLKALNRYRIIDRLSSR